MGQGYSLASQVAILYSLTISLFHDDFISPAYDGSHDNNRYRPDLDHPVSDSYSDLYKNFALATIVAAL